MTARKTPSKKSVNNGIGNKNNSIEFMQQLHEEFSEENLLGFSLDDLDIFSDDEKSNKLDFIALDEFEFEPIGRIDQESEHAKAMRESGEREIAGIRNDLEKLINRIVDKIKIKRGLAIDVALERSQGFEITGSVFNFYVPSFVYDLLIEYGFKDRVKDLYIQKPSFFEVGYNLRFKKDMILTRNAEFIYSCNFKRSIINIIECTSCNDTIRSKVNDFIEVLYNKNLPDMNCIECGSEFIVRHSDPVLIDGGLYKSKNSQLFDDLSIQGIRQTWKSRY